MSSQKEILEWLQEPDFGRELASELVERRRLTQVKFISRGRLPRILENLRVAMWTVAEEWRQIRETVRQRMEV